MALTLHSRKIWTPDLMAAWNFLCIGLYGIAHTKNKPALLAVSAFCAVMSGHMYLPGAISAGVITGILAIWFLLRNRAQALPWIIGSALGWLTFVPWLIATMNAENYGHAAKHMSFDQLKTALAWAATVPSPFNIYATYLRPVLNWMLQHSTSTWFYILLAFVAIGTLVSLLVYWYGLMRAAWKVRELAKDPLALASALLLLIMPLAIFLSGLGSYLHYWLATLPFVYHLIAWTANSGLLRRAAVVSCIISFLGAISFAIVVHERGGLAGEYGTSYNKQIEKTR
jgi:4-amino-4-deoxy-L-arabinose transferase-like glycosyltransferase